MNKKTKKELFEKAVKAIDDYTKAVEMDLIDFQNYFYEKQKELISEIKKRRLNNEFGEYALIDSIFE